MGGVQRTLRLRPSDRTRALAVRKLHRRAVSLTRRIVDRLVPVPTRRPRTAVAATPRHLASHRDLTAAKSTRPRAGLGSLGAIGLLHQILSIHPRFRGTSRLRLQRRLLLVRLGGERALPMGVALAVIVAGVVSLAPNAVQPVGAAQGSTQEVRLAVGGGDASLSGGANNLDGTADTASTIGQYVDDGTFYKPVAVDTTVESGSTLLRYYTVKSGDSLTGIASRFGVSMMTLWWANHLTSKDQLHQGQTLVIPPVNGLVITVAAGDTLTAIGAKYNVDPNAITQLNNLSDPNLVVGQVLILPGAKGAPIPTPAPTKHVSSGGGSISVPKVTVGGGWSWPVPGGYISQYFHYGHYGVDIAAPYGTPIVAAHSGTITYAGWNSDGCGYEVRIYVGSNLYIQNCHMSSVAVHVGQFVSRGQFVGRIGMSGDATGPHDHFAVSVGDPFTSGAYFVNPLRYV
jgi:murein DD-endopeptidase MepM/ murein hydrolase activator NlpD